ncbi:carbamoyltransferase family protein [Streptomyces sp. YGL11-2]|uniref:carbamoyltransferase family protein n=1 Tax=Streptomyces sp. YGL11-2 TaxID=3414028 RepID=UPI003CF75A88
MIVLGISGLPHAQARLRATTPGLSTLDERNCQGNDSAACLVVDGEIVAAAAEERFTGEKATGSLPVAAIDHCLRAAGIKSSDVDAIAHGFNYDRHRGLFEPSYFTEVLSGRTVVDGLTAAGWEEVESRFHPVDHHLAHAASAFQPSGYESALCVVSDGMGETESISVFVGRNGKLERVQRQPITSSLGLLYSICTRFLGFASNSDEYKVMGLAAYGDPAPFRALFAELARFDTDTGRIRIALPRGSLTEPELGYPQALEFLRAKAFTPVEADGQVHQREADFAAALQERHTQLLVELVEFWLARTGERSLCLAGGSFLNCKTNQTLCALPGVDRVFVQPAAGDDGTAIGAALAVSDSPYVAATPLFDPYLGPSYSAADVREALTESDDVAWEYVGLTGEYFAAAAGELAKDRIIAWFHGRMEFGPRALGNRSILGLPAGDRIKERINSLVKFREPFRPFAPAVLDTDLHELFDTPGSTPTTYMLCTAAVREEHRAAVAGVVHADGSARVQSVSRDVNENFWTLLTEVKRHTGAGCVVNTSFNVKGQPLIMDPRTAIDTFVRTSLDRLYIEGFVVSKRQ